MSDNASVLAGYPVEQEADVLLRDGSTVHVRPVRRDDASAIRTFLRGVSRESTALRFFGFPSEDWVVAWSTDVDYAERCGLVAETGEPRQVIAHAAYIRGSDGQAEVAFLVSDAWQGRGISTILLAHLAAMAARHQISTFTAEVLPTNHRMVEVFRQSGFPVSMLSAPDAIHVEFPTSLSADARARFEKRDQIAAVAAVRRVLEPRSVAVIGASGRRDTVGGQIVHNLLAGGFTGRLFAVNKHGHAVGAVPTYSSMVGVPEPVDLAVVAVPAPSVVAVARECAAASVRALVVISAGFAETGEAGNQRQRELLALCRSFGMRLVGPNCLGVINTSPGVSLNATFAEHEATPGNVAFMSQSGGVGIAIIEATRRLGIGLASFVSVGNKADLSGNDFLSYWEQDEDTDVALMYLESFGNPRKFARVARRFARRKPLLVVKSGRSGAGARATESHTGALLAASDVTVDALFEQAGVIRADSLHELFGVAALLANQPTPRGSRVAIVTNAGGPAIMCADACEAGGLEVAELPSPVREQLAASLPTAASCNNPIDMIATASAEDYRRALTTLIDADACDAALAIFVPPRGTARDSVATAIRQVAETRPDVAIAAVFMTAEGPPSQLRSDRVRVPGYEFPEDAARAVALGARYGRWRRQTSGAVLTPNGVQPERAAAILSAKLAHGEGWLSPGEVTGLLSSYGLPVLSSRIAADPAQAGELAQAMGLPVALKAIAPGVIHKRDVGGVRLGLQTPKAVRDAAAEISTSLRAAGHRLEGLLVEPMAAPGVELIVGVVHDPSFGPVLACGAGGTTAELISDVAVRITPITDLDAQQMLSSLRTFPMLTGYRGSPRCDLTAIADVLARVSAMVEAHPEIIELDINPLVVRPDGATAVDARVRVAAATPPPPVPSLHA